MKLERMNLLATCISTFVLGALMSWGYFSERRCPVQVKPIDVAVWIQILVALSVGAAAVYVPWKIASNEHKRRKDVLTELLRTALLPTKIVADRLSQNGTFVPQEIAAFYKDAKLQLDSLESYPLAEAANADLVSARTEAQSHCREVLETFQKHFQAMDATYYLQANFATAMAVHSAAIDKLFWRVSRMD